MTIAVYGDVKHQIKQTNKLSLHQLILVLRCYQDRYMHLARSRIEDVPLQYATIRFKLLVGILTHISLESFLWDVGKQNSPRCEVPKLSVTSGTFLFAFINSIEKLNKNEKLLLMPLKMKLDNWKVHLSQVGLVG